MRSESPGGYAEAVSLESSWVTVRTLAQAAMLTGLGIALHVVEGWVPLPAVPGLKLGLANVVTVYALAVLGFYPAVAIAVLRSLLGSLVGGTFLLPGFALSLAGASASALVMGIVARAVGFSPGRAGTAEAVAVSLSGAVSHNLAQLAVAMVLLNHAALAAYLPFLVAAALPTGYAIGLAAHKAMSAYAPANRNAGGTRG